MPRHRARALNKCCCGVRRVKMKLNSAYRAAPRHRNAVKLTTQRRNYMAAGGAESDRTYSQQAPSIESAAAIAADMAIACAGILAAANRNLRRRKSAAIAISPAPKRRQSRQCDGVSPAASNERRNEGAAVMGVGMTFVLLRNISTLKFRGSRRK